MTNAEARCNKSLRPRKPEGSLGRTAQDVHLDSHTAPELCESYLDSIQQKCFRDALIRFRLGISKINVHKNRYKASDLSTGNDCPFCPGVEENECHLCFKCSMYNDIRPNVMKNIEPYQESAQLARLMYSRDDETIRKIAWYMFKAFELIKRAMGSMGQ